METRGNHHSNELVSYSDYLFRGSKLHVRCETASQLQRGEGGEREHKPIRNKKISFTVIKTIKSIELFEQRTVQCSTSQSTSGHALLTVIYHLIILKV